MIKTVAYFPLQCALNSAPVMSAVLDIFQASGIQVQENSMDSDAAVIWSVLWHGRMRHNRQVYEHYQAQSKPVIIVEIGALYRGNTWKIAVNHITGNGYYGHQENLDWDRPRKLGISLAVNHIPNPNIIIAMQHAKSLQVAELPSMEKWLHEQIRLIRNVTDRPITIRPHPRSPINLIQLPCDVVIETPKKLFNTYDSFDMHFNCHAVVNYNSGPGIQAAIAGCRPVVDASSLAAPVSVQLVDIEKPYVVDRSQWLVEICHTEYTLDELKQGTWLKRIENALMI